MIIKTEDLTVEQRHQSEVAERFRNEIADHEMGILLDDGPYRHLRFKKTGTSWYRFDLITWPGRLTIDGEMGTFTFARLDDMFEFFRKERINPHYWQEKIRGSHNESERYCENVFRQHVAETIADHVDEFPGLADAIKAELDGEDYGHEEYARRFFSEFRHYEPDGHTFEFHDTWEWDLKDYTSHYLWCCHAIVWGIDQYDQAKAAASSSPDTPKEGRS